MSHRTSPSTTSAVTCQACPIMGIPRDPTTVLTMGIPRGSDVIKPQRSQNDVADHCKPLWLLTSFDYPRDTTYQLWNHVNSVLNLPTNCSNRAQQVLCASRNAPNPALPQPMAIPGRGTCATSCTLTFASKTWPATRSTDPRTRQAAPKASQERGDLVIW